ncbi:Hypothetical predicted protein [Cloeon dipterum]|uniref:Uncharacterized protein n=1 Tax=Cloeon dipterum TaxID=197152 RepID=A0A8S1DLN6_9INSE|nr:Hypothetical predicted protein [Cloeon dipterum]
MESRFIWVLLTLLAISQGVYAMTFADSLALVLILGICVIGIFACLGYYARRRDESFNTL